MTPFSCIIRRYLGTDISLNASYQYFCSNILLTSVSQLLSVMSTFYTFFWACVTGIAATQLEMIRSKSVDENGTGLPYYGVFLGEFRNETYGIESGKVYLVNESHIQIVQFTVQLTNDLSKLLLSFSTSTEIGKPEEIYEVKTDDQEEEYLEAKTALIDTINNTRLVLKIPNGSFHKWKFFGIVSESEWLYLTAVSLSSRSAPRPYCCLPALNGWVYNVKSDPVEVLDARTLRIPKFSFEGQKPPDGWFFAGKGSIEKAHGQKCYVKGRDTDSLWCPLREEYYDRDMVIQLPQNETVYSVRWLSVYCVAVGVDFGHIEFELSPLTQPVPPVIPPISAPNVSSSDESWSVPIVFAVPENDRTKWVDLTFTLGPPGGVKAKANRGTCDNLERVWYVQGEMQPDIYVQRETTYRLKIYGGLENPVYITSERSGAWAQKTETEKLLIKNFVGEKGDAAGDLCEWKPINDTRALKPDFFATFSEYRHFLNLHCSNSANPFELKWIPGDDVPSEIYYASFTQYYLGGRIFVCDELEGDALKPKCAK